MNNEETQFLNEESTPKEQPKATTATAPSATSQPKKSGSKAKVVAAAAGGFAAGAAVGTGASAAAMAPEAVDKPVAENVETPEPEQVIMANDEGVRYAHVDADNFADAYAQARAQVGPGGVFEYNGQLYNTYTAHEWDAMSADERADFQGRVGGISPEHHTAHVESSPEVQPVIEVEPIAENPASEGEVHILGVEAVETPDGEILNVAIIESEGEQALLVDVDNDGTIDAMVYDANHDGDISPDEIHDMQDANLDIADLLEAEAAQDGDMFLADNDDMPDYYNDADSIMSV